MRQPGTKKYMLWLFPEKVILIFKIMSVNLNNLKVSMSSIIDIDCREVTLLLNSWISDRLSLDSLNWLKEKQAKIAEVIPEEQFFTSFSSVPRYVGKKDLNLTSEDLLKASEIKPGWFPVHWSIDQTVRCLLILSLNKQQQDKYLKTINQLFLNADVSELVALYQSLPVLPYPEKLVERAKEGIRSNMTAVFNAVALRNPYPAQYLDESAWNQMVLKALFVGSPLSPIIGLDQRANQTLARMLWDYAHERWAAKRPVTPELWRLVGPFANPEMLADIEKVFNQPEEINQKAAALACSMSTLPEAQTLLATRPDLKNLITQSELTWETLI